MKKGASKARSIVVGCASVLVREHELRMGATVSRNLHNFTSDTAIGFHLFDCKVEISMLVIFLLLFLR